MTLSNITTRVGLLGSIAIAVLVALKGDLVLAAGILTSAVSSLPQGGRNG